MADTRVKIVDIQVRYQEAVEGMAKYRAAIAEVKKYQKDLKDELKDGKVTQEEYDRAMAASEVYLKQQNDSLQTLSKQVNNQVKVQKEQEGSLKSLRAQLAQAKDAYESLGKAEREGAKGTDLQEKISKLNTEISKATKNQELQEGSIRKLRAELAKAKADYEGLSKAEREGAKGQDLENKISNLNKQIKESTNTVKAQEGSLVQLRQKLSDLTKQYDAMGRAERESAKGHELKDKINAITTELKTAEEETQRFYRNVGNYKSATEGLDSIKAKITDIGKSMLMALGGGSLLAFSKDVLQVTRDFEDGMARVKAVTNASAEDLKMMTDRARELGRTTIYHATDAANALETLSRGGLSAAEATEAVGMTLKMAQANTIGLNESADIMIRTMRGFKLPFTEEEMVKASDILSKTAASSATNILEIAEAMKNAAPFASALGIPLNEVSAALGVLADRGVRASDAGTAMRMVLLGLAEPTSRAGKVFRNYGINIDQVALQTKGLSGVLDELNKSGIMQSTHSMNELSAIFGRRAVSSVTSLIGSLDDYQAKLQGINESNGTTARMFEDSYSKVSVEIFSLSSAWESFKIALGESNNSALIEPLHALTEAVRFLEGHLSEVGNLVMTAIASISFAKLITSAKAAFVTIRESAITNAEEASTQVRTLQQQEITLRKTVANQTVAIEEASGTERTMIEAKLLANKRQLAETEKALVKAKTNEITLWEKAAAVNTAGTWKSAMAAASIAVSGFVTAAKTALKGFVFTAVIMLAFEALQKLFSLMGDGDSWFGKLTSAVTGFIKNGLSWLLKQFRAVSDWFSEFMENSRLMQVALIGIKTNMAVVGAVFKSVWTIIKTGLKQMWEGFKLIAGIIGAVGTALEGLLTFNWTQMKRGLTQVATSVTDFLKGTVKNARDAGTEIADNVVDAYNSTVKAIGDAANSKAFGGGGSAASPAPAKPSAPKGKTPDKAVADEADAEGDKPKTKYTEDAKKAKEDWETAKAEYDRIIKDQNATTEDVLAARKNLQDAQKAYEDLTGNKQSKGSKGGKQDNTAKKQAELERKAFEEAEKAMLALMKDTAAKRRLQIEQQYESEIRKLKVQLATEKNLTEDAKEAIRRTILLKEQKKNEELKKLDDVELKRQIEEQQKLTASRLSVVKDGTWQELQLKKDQINEKLRLDQLALKQEREDIMADADEKIRQAEEQYGKDSSMALAAYQDKETLELEYQERMANLREKARQDDLELDQQYRQKLYDQRQQAFQNEQTQFEIWSEEWKIADMANKDEYVERELGFQQLNLDVVEDGEFAVLAVRLQAAEERYENIVRMGQLENETLEQYRARELAAEKAKVDAKLAFQNAEIKNRKAYYNSMRSLTNSLVSLTAAIGESDENFARLSKIITLAQITIDTGRAISAGVASASALPYPANLAAIASTVATVLANIATAISTVKSANFAEGGKVHGPGTGTSDSVPANLSNGEFVMTAKATKLFEPLLVAMNAIGAGVVPQVSNSYRETPLYADELADSFKEAAQEIHPQVSVVEIADKQREVEVIETLDTF